MEQGKKTVAVIGAGPSGLTTVKTCIDENIEPVCFERESELGGLWNFSEEESRSSVYNSIVINTSKEMSGFSDFPIPKPFPMFITHTQVKEYLHLYASHFNLYKHIVFDTTVIQVCKADDYATSGRWIVSYQRKDSETMSTAVFDGVIVCSGHYWYPSMPTFSGMDLFQGVQIHSNSYKCPDKFKGKKVIVVGFGNSAADIATELSHNASQAYLSTRRASWVISRLSNRGIPWDFYYERRIYTKLPSMIFEWMFLKFAQGRFDHDNFGIRPHHGILNAPGVISDELPYRIANGTLIMKPNISHFTKRTVVFEDGSVVEDVDVVIYCTGYKISFDFLSEEISKVVDNQVSLYKYVFPPDLIQPTLAFIALTQSSGAMFSLMELQARWATRVLTGKCLLPSPEVMIEDIESKRQKIENQFIHTKRLTVQVSSIGYRDEIAEFIGCKPSLWKLLISDPYIALLCFFGPCTPAQYRLHGPGGWNGAKQAIRSSYSNNYPTIDTKALRKTGLFRQSVFDIVYSMIMDATCFALIVPFVNFVSESLFS